VPRPCPSPRCLPCFLSTALSLPTFGRVGPKEVQVERPAIAAPSGLLHVASKRDRGTNDLDGRRPVATLPRSGEGRAVNEIVREAETACARAREARTRSTPPLSPHHAAGRQARTGHGGAVLRRAVGCGRPVCPVVGGEDGALARRPQAPLETVEKFLTGNVPTLYPCEESALGFRLAGCSVDRNTAGLWRSGFRCDRCASHFHQLRPESGLPIVTQPTRPGFTS
jgi:hypothetical protein